MQRGERFDDLATRQCAAESPSGEFFRLSLPAVAKGG